MGAGGRIAGQWALVSSPIGHLCPEIDFPLGPGFPQQQRWGPMGGGRIQKGEKHNGVAGYPMEADVTLYHSRAALAPKGARAGTQVHDKVSTRQWANDNVKTSPQGVKFGVLMLSTCFHWREGWRP